MKTEEVTGGWVINENGLLQTAPEILIEQQNCYPGGMLMPGRATGLGDYRYAYNGMEQDQEVTGDYGNSYTTEFRQYDPRLMRWKSLDPLMMKFPWMSPYVAFDNNPVYYIDPLGLEGDPVTVIGNEDKPDRRYKDENGKRQKWKEGDMYIDKDGHEHKYLGEYRNRKFKDSWEFTKAQKVKEVTVSANYSDRKETTEFYTDTRHNVTEAPIHRMIPGDVVKQSLYDPYGVDYTNGILPDYREYTYLGSGQFELTKKFKNETTAELVVEGAIFTIPVGGVFKVVGAGIKLLRLSKSVVRVLGNGYKAVAEVTVSVNNKPLLQKLTSWETGEWVKVYEAGILNGEKVEIHYFRHTQSGKVFDVKQKYSKWQQKAFKKIK